MGVKDLLPLLKANYPHVEQVLPIRLFRGMKIAIDFDVIIRAHYSIVYENILMLGNTFTNDPDPEALFHDLKVSILSHLRNRYVANEITPIIVLSGPAPPEKDEYARADRKKTKDAAAARLNLFEERYRCNSEADYDRLAPSVQRDHAKLRLSASDFPRGLTKRVAEAAKEAGYTVLQSLYEAEELCAALCLEDRVQAVYSTDSDNLVRRARCMIDKFIDREDGLYVHTYCYSEEMLKALRLTYVQFVELCIMLGCDYNRRKYKMGPAESYPALLDHGSIANIEKAKNISLDCLNVDRCKEIFNLNHRRDSKACCDPSDHELFAFVFGDE